MPETIAPQLATLVSAPPTRGEWTFEIKLDGYRVLARCDHGAVRLFTRNSNDWTDKMPTLARELALLSVDTAWLDGEIVIQTADGLPDFNALQNAFDKRQGDAAMTYFVFDLLYLDGHDLRPLDLRARRAMLEVLLDRHEQRQVRLSRTFDADGASVLQSACKMGLEGIVAKHLDAPYRGGVRSEAWQKIKCERRQEFVIGGFTTRAGSSREIGSLLLGIYDDEGRLRSVGSVGTGWDSTLASAILHNLEKLETGAPAFDPQFAPTKGRWSKRAAGGERWVRPTAVCEVSFVEWTPDGHIRHPRFRGMRTDKPAASVRREPNA
jgi:bifunctional non-homologous end joining protein LigD